VGAIDPIRYVFGINFPEEIAVTGFDDAFQTGNPSNRLKTYRQPITKIAELIVRDSA